MNRPLLPDVYLPRDTDAYIEGWVSSDRRFLLAQQGIEAQYLNEEGYEVEFLYRGTGFEIKSGDYDSRASLKWYVGKKRVGFVLGPHPYVGKLGELNYAPIYWVFFLAEGPRLFDGDLAPVPSEQETGLRSLLVEYDGVLS